MRDTDGAGALHVGGMSGRRVGGVGGRYAGGECEDHLFGCGVDVPVNEGSNLVAVVSRITNASCLLL